MSGNSSRYCWGKNRPGRGCGRNTTNIACRSRELIYLAEFRLTHDFRANMLVEVAMLAALALGLMRLAAQLRGRSDWPDLFFPISLLHLGHWENWLLGYQICFALFIVFVTGLVVVSIRTTRETAFRSGLLGGVLLLLAALTGGSGLALVPPVVAWLLYLAVIVRRTARESAGAGRRGSRARVGRVSRDLLHRVQAARESSAADQ